MTSRVGCFSPQRIGCCLHILVLCLRFPQSERLSTRKDCQVHTGYQHITLQRWWGSCHSQLHSQLCTIWSHIPCWVFTAPLCFSPFLVSFFSTPSLLRVLGSSWEHLVWTCRYPSLSAPYTRWQHNCLADTLQQTSHPGSSGCSIWAWSTMPTRTCRL